MYEHDSQNFDGSSFCVVGITRDNSDNLIPCYSVLAKALPDYVDIQSELSSVRNFSNGERLLEDGSIRTGCDESKSISLDGYTAYWMPKLDSVFTYLMESYYKNTKDKSSEQTNTGKSYTGYLPNKIDIEQLIRLIKGKKVALFTGAGISVEAGIVDLKGLMDLGSSLFSPVEQYYEDIIKGNTAARLEICNKMYSMFTEPEPTQTHWIIKELCDLYGFTLITGNMDGLHQKTGIQPIFQNSGEVVIPKLNSYDVLITIGLSEAGIGKTAEEYHSGNPDGSIVAINKLAPSYLNNKDYFIEGESDSILADLKQKIQKDYNK